MHPLTELRIVNADLLGEMLQIPDSKPYLLTQEPALRAPCGLDSSPLAV